MSDLIAALLRPLARAGTGCLLALALIVPGQASHASVQVVHSDANGLDIELTAPLSVSAVDGSADTVSLWVDDWPRSATPGLPAIPYAVIPIVMPPTGSARAMIVSREDTSAAVGPVELATEDTPIGPANMLRPPSGRSVSPTGPAAGDVVVEVLGNSRGVRVGRVVVRAVSYADGVVRWAKRMTVAVRFTDPPTGTVGRAARQTTSPHPAMVAANAGQIAAFAVPPTATARAARVSATPTSQTRVRIYVTEKGIHRIPAEDLTVLGAENGVDFSGVAPATFRVLTRGREIPIYVEGHDEPGEWTAIEFYAEPNLERYRAESPDAYRDPYVDAGIYWLQWGGQRGARLVEESGSDTLRPGETAIQAQSYRHTVHAEKDLKTVQFAFLNDIHSDPVIWGTSRTGTPLAVPFTLQPPALNPAIVPSIELIGRAATTAVIEADVSVNDVVIGRLRADEGVKYNDLVRITGHGSLPLAAGENTLKFEVMGAGGIAMLNWFALTYESRYATLTDEIEFRRPPTPSSGLFSYSVSGFTNPNVSVYKLGVSRLRDFTVENTVAVDGELASGYTVRIQDRIEGSDPVYYAVTDNAKLTPTRMDVVPAWDRPLQDPTRHGDYLVITHPAFVDSIARLAEYRSTVAGGSHDVAVVNVDQIYDEFDDGYPTAEAIRSFVQYAARNWSDPKPLYVLIVGDGVLRMSRNNLLGSNYLIPSPIEISRHWGHVGADQRLGELDDTDILPDLFVGRIPISSIGDLTTMMSKIIEFETSPQRTPWRNTTLFAASGDYGESIYSRQCEIISGRLSTRYEQSKFYAGGITAGAEMFGGIATDMINYLNAGSMWTVYVGHGAGEVWGYGALLANSDVPRLTNQGKAGIILSMTCFTGAFEEDFGMASLGEHMLYDAGSGGAAAWIGATGLGWTNNDFYLLESLTRTAINAPSVYGTLGAAFAAAKIDYALRNDGPNAERGGYTHTIVYGYNILGDPGLQIALPPATTSLAPGSRTPLPGQTVTVTGSVPGIQNGSADLALYKGPNYRFATYTGLPVSSGSFSAAITVPDTLSAQTLTIRSYAHSAEGDADNVGVVRIAVASSLIDSVVVRRSPRDAITASAVVYDGDGIQSVDCVVILNSLGATDVIPMALATGARYETTRPANLDGLSYDANVSIRPTIRVIDSTNDTTTFADIDPVYPNRRPALALGGISVASTGEPAVAATVSNTGTAASDSVITQLWLSSESGYALLSEARTGPLSATIDFTGSGDTSIGARPAAGIADLAGAGFPLQRVEVHLALPGSLLTGAYPGAALRVTARELNTAPAQAAALLEVPPTRGYFNATAQDTLRIRTAPGTKWLLVPPGAFATSTLVGIDDTALPVREGQPGLDPVASSATSVAWATDILPVPGHEPSLVLPFDAADPQIRAALDTDRLKPALWQEARSQWWVLPGETQSWSDGNVRITLDKPGIYALIRSSDTTPPSIQVIAHGQQFSDGSYVSSTLPFELLVEDSNGVDVAPGAIRVWIEGEQLPDSALVVPDVLASTTSVPVTVTAPRVAGREADYGIRVTAADLAGNEAEQTASFRVAEEALLNFWGNFPNPFDADGTTFAFETSQAMQLVRFRIYDISGRLVLQFDNFDMSQIYPDDPPEMHQRSSGTLNDSNSRPLIGPAYHEVRWGGKDSRGNPLPNGVYFGIVTVKKREPNYETLEHVFKMVKLQ